MPPEVFDQIYLNSYGAWGDLLSEFIYDLYKDYPYREIPAHTVVEIAKQGKPATLCRWNTQSMELLDGYQFPPGYFGNSPQFIPRNPGSGGARDGYLVCTVNYNLDPCNRLKSGKSEIWIFDAAHLQAGPICQLSHPQLSFAFRTHSTWVPAIAPRNSRYYIGVREDFQKRVEQAVPAMPAVQRKIQALFDSEIYPQFPQG